MNATPKVPELDPKKAYRRSEWLLIFIAIFLMDHFPGFFFQDKIPHIVAIGLLWGIYFLLLKLALYLGDRFLGKWISPLGIEVGLVIAIAYCIDDVQSQSSSLGPSAGHWIDTITVVATALLWLFAFCMEGRKRRPLLALPGVLALGVVVLSAVFPGIPTRGAIAQAKKDIPPRYEVETIHYGPGKTYDFGTESYSRYVNVPKHQSTLREKYFGYTPGRIPYIGEIYMPKGKMHAPLLVFVHGNHNMLADNYKGYDYLGRYLAARGIGFVSVEQSHYNAFLQKGFSGENDARALGLMDHASVILNDPRLAKRFDKNRLYFGGHSRGGEAAAVAGALVGLTKNPDTGEATKNLHAAGVIAVAPTDGQYSPGDRPVDLNVPYLLIQGTHDQDVSSLEGMDQYVRTDGEKMQVLVGYANHSKFNTQWGNLDREGLLAATLHRADIMDGKEQERFLEVLAYGFIEDEGLLDNPKEYLPSAPYFMARQKPGLVIADFEEDAELTTATLKGAALSMDGTHTEKHFQPAGRGGNNHVAYIRGTLTATIPQSLSGDFAMDIAPTGSVPNMTLTLEDKNGQSVEIQVDKENFRSPLETMLLKWQQLADKTERKSALVSYRIGEKTIAEKNPHFHMNDLRRIVLTTDGEVALDNMRIESKND
ncbi:hypothetical protein HMPREF1863_00352 [Aedoeadaptatus coxii]|uniref:Uncharacterized protein n=1 Tax=Aedoeadaptatus coxii TaxID=755172 RepID=A0A134AK35_9FIRM|nr:alpha/beta hydrolase [Peptoniphilus coxii]KXB68035.1 hypothetical protein HMPREF1863_00352 [Peptoniphilus coxii]